jgi:hypothetical protein
MFLRKFGNNLPYGTVSNPGRSQFEDSPQRKSRISEMTNKVNPEIDGQTA